MVKIPLKPLFEDYTEEDWKNFEADGVRLLQDAFRRLRELAPNAIAEDITSINPESSNTAGPALAALFKNASSQEELILEGYKPVSHHGLLWVKDSANMITLKPR